MATAHVSPSETPDVSGVEDRGGEYNTENEKEDDMSNVPEHIRAEEEKMRKASHKQDMARNKKFEKERQKDIQGGEKVVDTKFKALEYLLNQSKVLLYY